MGFFLGSLLRFIVNIAVGILKVVCKLLIFFGLWIPLVYIIFGVVLNKTIGFNPLDFSLYSTIYLSGLIGAIVACVIIAVKNGVLKPAKSVYSGFVNPLGRKPAPAEGEKSPEEALKNKWENSRAARKLSPPEIQEFSPSSVPPQKYGGYFRPTPNIPDSRDFGAPALNVEDAYDWLPTAPAIVPQYGFNGQPYVNYGESYNPYPPRPTPQGRHEIFRQEAAKIYQSPAYGGVSEQPIASYFSKLQEGLYVCEYGNRFELYTFMPDGSRRHVKTEYK